ncbi:MAG: hypothetical protein CEE40_00960 [Chloroflexi bacterium B3_Chlor]|nr:MAG: hypothetical protein CEE40_00960 [Chloroflexi bacterium B3_Chlor]
MHSTAYKPSSGFPLVLLTSLIVGAFLSRFLAESGHSYFSVFYHWMPTVFLMALVTFTMWLGRFLLSRRASRTDTLLADALSYLPLLLLVLYLLRPQVNPIQARVLLLGSVALVASQKLAEFLGREWLDRAVLATVFLVPLAIYLITLAPTVGEHDTFEFQVLSYELGVAHPTGYPLYILLGKLFTLLPLGNVAYRVNLSSALFAATTAAVVHATIYHLTGHRSTSALAALTFAFSHSLWSQAVVAEVYALNALFVVSICYLLLRCFHEKPVDASDAQTQATPPTAITRITAFGAANQVLALICATSFIYGLSLTHHRTMVLLGPAIVAYVLLKRGRSLLNVRRIATLASAFVAPLLGVHLYIPLRWWQIHGRMITWTEFTNLVLGTQFSAALRWDAWLRGPDRLLIYLRILLEQYPVPALVLALAGIIWLLWPNRSPARYPGWKEGVFLVTAFIAYVLFGLGYYVPDVSLFLIPSHLIIAIALGIGVTSLGELAEKFLARIPGIALSTRRLLVQSTTLTLAGLLPMGLVWINMPRVDRSDEYAWYDWGRYVLEQELPPAAVILADSQRIAPLYYLQKVEGVRPDTEAGVFPDEESNRGELERRLSEGRRVFLARFLPGLETTYHLRSLGPLVEVNPQMLTELPSNLSRLDSDFGGKILLRGYRLDSPDVSATDTLRVTLYWQAPESAPQNYDVRLRLKSPSGHIWYQTKGRPPVKGLYPTAAWHPGEIIPDFHELDLAGLLPPGKYALQAGLFTPFGQEGLAPLDTGEDYLTLAEVSISHPAAWFPPIQHPLRANFDNQIMLLGYDFPSTGHPAAEIPLTLYWQGVGQVTHDYNVALELMESNGDISWQSIEPPLFGEYPTSGWTEGQLLADTHQVTIPSRASGELCLRIALQDSASNRTVPVFNGWLARQEDRAVLASIHVEDLPRRSGNREHLPVNFENKILLVDYELHNVHVRKGGGLQLTLTWQALTSVDEDYTVFVHILDENDQIWGQEDIQPVYGTYPTSRWREGEMVLDSHTVWTDKSAPLGLYQIEVGLYLLRTMERLQVLSPSGTPTDNRVLIELMEIVP